MPNIDGINFLEIIKEDPNYFDIPVIVVSGILQGIIMQEY